MTPDQQNYLKDHLPYTLQMLRYTHRYMTEHAERSLIYNAHHEAFCVSARNLDRFLTNNDTSNFNAKDFVLLYKHPKRESVKDIFVRMERQVFHFGKTRPTDPNGKVDLVQADKFYRWLEPAFLSFFNMLSSDQRGFWSMEIADPRTPNPAMSVSLAGPLTTSSAISTTMMFVTGPAAREPYQRGE